jgi:hypothetical protein
VSRQERSEDLFIHFRKAIVRNELAAEHAEIGDLLCDQMAVEYCAGKEEVYPLRNDGYEKMAGTIETRHRGKFFLRELGLLEQKCTSTCSLFVGNPE